MLASYNEFNNEIKWNSNEKLNRVLEKNDTIDKNKKTESFDDLIYKVLTDCINQQSEIEINDHINELTTQDALHDYFKMLAIADNTTHSDIFADNTDDIENNFLGHDGRISLAYENLRNIPQKIAENFSTDTKFLDLSFNNFKDLSFLSFFKGLNTLILDKNLEPDETTLPYLTNLEILWLNNCNIINVPKWIYRIQIQCPNIKQLSLIGNPGARSLLTGAKSNEEHDYRSFVTEILKTLTHLDGTPVTNTASPINPILRSVNSTPLIIHSNFTSGSLNQRNEISLPSLFQQQTTIKKTKSTQYNNNNNSTMLFKNNSINSTFIPHGGKLSSSTSVKSYYIHNSQQQYQKHYNHQRKVLSGKEKEKSNNTNNKKNSNIGGTQNKKKRVITNSFKDLFRFNSQRRNSCQSSTSS